MSETHHHHDYTAANAKHFNESAETYRTELSLELAKRCAAAIQKKSSLNSEKSVVLDFACGPGLIAFELVSHVKRIVGADAAQAMVNVFNKTAEQNGLTKDKCEAIFVEKLNGDANDLNGELFDVIICVQSYHHFEDTQQVTRALVQRLQPNGRLIVLDFVDDEGVAALFGHGHSHRHEHIVAHKHGFSMDHMTKLFQDSGLQNVHVESAFKITKAEIKALKGHEVFGHAIEHEGDFTLHYFIACGEK